MSRVLIICGVLVALVLARLQAEEHRAGKTVSGVVRDSAGKPVEGAEVWLVMTDMWFFESDVPSSTKTSAAGTFELAVPQRWLDAIPQVRQELGFVAH
ncbi:MAG TPA: carboxypeptidase-like regulatory domain-containing protein, partial [Pirellulaceae bacterium]|nr:carboxypeptidase-like regulatory domain-containing protein [Pirellulaceae bacterium]